MSSKTKYWSSLVAVSWISLKTNLSTIRSVTRTLLFSFSQYWVSCAENQFFFLSLSKCWCENRMKRYKITIHNYCFQVQMPIDHLSVVGEFVPFLMHFGITVRVFAAKFSYIETTNLVSWIAINRRNVTLIHLNSLPEV